MTFLAPHAWCLQQASGLFFSDRSATFRAQTTPTSGRAWRRVTMPPASLRTCHLRGLSRPPRPGARFAANTGFATGCVVTSEEPHARTILQASGLFTSERAATTQRPDSGARAPQHSPAPGPLKPQGLVSARETRHALVEALHLVPRAQPLWSPPLRLPRPVPAGGAAVDAEWQAWGSAYNPLTQPRGPPHICVRQAPG